MDGIPVERVYYKRRWTPDEDTVPAIGAALVRHVEEHPALQKTDIVYAHFLWTAGAAALSLRQRFGWPVAAIARGSEMNDWQDVNPHCKDYVSQVSRETDGLLTNCHYLRQRAEEITPGVQERVQVVYNGCDSQFFAPVPDMVALRAKLGLEYEVLIGTVRNVGYRFVPEASQSDSESLTERHETPCASLPCSHSGDQSPPSNT